MDKTILVVSDDSSIINSLRPLFGSEYKLLEAYDIETGRTKIDSEKVSMVIIDVKLSEEVGPAIYEEHINAFLERNILVHLLMEEQEMREAAHLVEISDECLVKPIEPDKLILNIESLLYLRQVEEKVLKVYENLNLLEDGLISAREKIAHEENLFEDLRDFMLEIKKKMQKKNRELMESEERYRRITDAITDYIFTVRIENGHPVETIHGPACVAVTGYTPGEYASDPNLWIRMVPEEDRKIVQEQAERILSGQDTQPIEHRILRKEGIIRWVSSILVPHCDTQGRLLSYDGLIKDITERKEMELKLQRSEARFRTMFDAATDGLFLSDLTATKYILVNKACLQMLGYTLEEFMELKLENIHPPGELPFVHAEIAKFNLTALGSRAEVHFLRKDHSVFLAEVNQTRMTFEDQDYVLIMFRDITEYKKAEEALKQNQAILIQAEKMAGIGTLASGIAHEVNNPLAAILTYAQLMQSKIKNGKLTMDKVMEYANKMEKVAMHCKATIQNLLDFSRETKDSEQLFPLPEVIDASVSLLFHQLELQNIKISKEIENVTILANKNQLMQVFVNMLTNAKDAMPEGGELTIAAQKLDGHINIVFSDTGTGISKDYLKRIFEPFFTTKEAGKGTGIGLYMCYKIIENMGGTIEVKSEIGKGTTFTIKLPV